MRLLVALVLVAATSSLSAQRSSAPIERRTTALHPMRYLVSRPLGWKVGESYPVVVAITDGDREFEKAVRAFMAARGTRPWVIVVPEVLTAGPEWSRSSQRTRFDYDRFALRRIRNGTACGFDAAGMTALIADVKRLDSPAGRFYLTGWEAGGHVIWAQYFRHPQTWAAIAAISPNYVGRCMEDRKFAAPPADSGPPVRLFYGAQDSGGVPGGILYAQWITVKRIADRQGLAHLSEKSVPARPRGPMPLEVLAWFDSLRAGGSSRH